MREIIFRGKRVDNGEWVYGNLLKTSVDKKSNPEFTDGIQVFEDNEFKAVHAVIPETVGQFTGLTDKNGNRIFEGDKIKHVNGQKRVNNEWVDNEEYFEVKFKHGALRPVEFFWSSDAIEVISNIHESLTPNK